MRHCRLGYHMHSISFLLLWNINCKIGCTRYSYICFKSQKIERKQKLRPDVRSGRSFFFFPLFFCCDIWLAGKQILFLMSRHALFPITAPMGGMESLLQNGRRNAWNVVCRLDVKCHFFIFPRREGGKKKCDVFLGNSCLFDSFRNPFRWTGVESIVTKIIDTK